MTTFAEFARIHGLLLERPIPDGRIHRVGTEGHPRKRNGTYRYTGDWGWICNWEITGEAIVWREANPQERPGLRQPVRVSAAVQRAMDEERQKREKAAQRARRLLEQADFTTHPYMAAKGFPEHRVLVDTEGRMVVPMRHWSNANRLQSVQWIWPDGTKKFLPFGRAEDAVYQIGSNLHGEVWLCEGVATAHSVDAAVRHLHRSARVIACFSAHNLAHVARQLVADRIYVVADHDKPNPQTGLRAGHVAAEKAGKPFVMPAREGEDANDVHQRDGLVALANLLRGVLMT